MKQRSHVNDYHTKGTYMVTIVVAGRKPLLGCLEGDVSVPYGNHGAPGIKLSPLGRVIVQEEIPKIQEHYPLISVWKTAIMPDHIHMIIRVKDDLQQGASLGIAIKGFKVGCNAAYWKMYNIQSSPRQGLFERGYNDKILLEAGQLDRWKRYLDDNPRRLLIKRLFPNYFTVVHNAVIDGQDCQMVGNRFLMDIPNKKAVIVHRRYTANEVAKLTCQWLECGAQGGVLVSAAIAPAEKAVLREALNRGYRVIWLRNNGFPKLYKPAGESFDACSQGRMLQLSPWEYTSRKKDITREQCLFLNSLAESIASEVIASEVIASNTVACHDGAL